VGVLRCEECVSTLWRDIFLKNKKVLGGKKLS
jgi:hypothetical protein